MALEPFVAFAPISGSVAIALHHRNSEAAPAAARECVRHAAGNMTKLHVQCTLSARHLPSLFTLCTVPALVSTCAVSSRRQLGLLTICHLSSLPALSLLSAQLVSGMQGVRATRRLEHDKPLCTAYYIWTRFFRGARGYLAHKNPSPSGPYNGPMPRTSGDSRRGGDSCERGTPLAGHLTCTPGPVSGVGKITLRCLQGAGPPRSSETATPEDPTVDLWLWCYGGRGGRTFSSERGQPHGARHTLLAVSCETTGRR